MPASATPSEAAVEDRIFGLLAARRQGATICPSEVARALDAGTGRWRDLMPLVRQVAQRLAQSKRLHVTRAGMPVDATAGGGPVRLGRPAGQVMRGIPDELTLDQRDS